MRTLRTDKESNLVVFEVEHISVLNDEFLDRLPWPEGTKKAAFRFERPIEGAPGKLLKHISARHYPRIGYRARPEDLVAPSPIEADSAIKLSPSEDLEMLGSLMRTTYSAHLSRWGDLVQADFHQQLEDYLKKHMSLANTVMITKEGSPAALLNLMQVQDPCFGVPVEHIGWAWADSRLAPQERRMVRAIVVARLMQSRAQSLHAFISYYNFISLNSIVRIGFKPACVHVLRNDR